MKFAIVLVISVIATIATVATGESAVSAGRDLAGVLLKVIEKAGQKRSVGVANEANGQIRLWCASKDDRIRKDDKDYIDTNPGEGFGWGFTPNVFTGFSGKTLFWCTFCYNNERRGFDVYDQKWEDDEKKVPKNGVLMWKFSNDKAVLNDGAITHEYKDLKKQDSC